MSRSPRRTRLLAATVSLGLGGLALIGAPSASAARPEARPSPALSSTPSATVRPAAGTTAFGDRALVVRDRTVTVRTGPKRDIVLPVATRLYVPDQARRATPQPAILMTHGFGLDQDATEILTMARFFASHGYVVLTFTSSGFGTSGGCVTLQSTDYDVQTARALITRVLAPRGDVRHDNRGPIVGTIGGSYGGGIQLPLAAADKRVRATVPYRTWNDLAYSLDPNNRIAPGDPTGFTHSRNPQGVFKQEWTSLFQALGNAQPAMGNGSCPQTKQASGDAAEIAATGVCPGYYLALCQAADRLIATGDTAPADRTLLARASAQTFLDQVTAPTLLVQGQSDTLFNLNDAAASYVGLKNRRVPVGLIWNSGGHGGYSSKPGECEQYDGMDRSVAVLDRCYLTLRSLGWMNHWLRGSRGGRGPAVAYYRDWVSYDGTGPNSEQYAGSVRMDTPGTTFTLSGTDALAQPGTTAQPGTARLANPVGGSPAAYTEKSNFTGPDAQPSSQNVPPTEVEGQHVDFVSAAFAAPAVAAGIPSARLRITNTNGGDMVFFGKVYDVAPDGSSTLIHRLIAPVRVPASAAGQPVDLKLLGFVHRFETGHRVRLTLATTDQTSYNAKVADVLRVQTGPGSTFRLPTRGAISFR